MMTQINSRWRTWEPWMRNIRGFRLAEILGIHPTDVSEMRKQGLPSICMGATFRYDVTVALYWRAGRTFAQILGINTHFPPVLTTLNGFILYARFAGFSTDTTKSLARQIGIRAGGSTHLVDHLLTDHPLLTVSLKALPPPHLDLPRMRISGFLPAV